METSDKTKVSSDFIFTRLFVSGGIVFFVFQFFEERRTEGLYTELCFLGIFLFLFILIYYFTRPKVYINNSNFYFKKFNKPEIQVPFNNIQSIERIKFGVKGNFSYKIRYLDKTRKKDRILFYTDSYRQMQELIGQVKESNQSVRIL